DKNRIRHDLLLFETKNCLFFYISLALIGASARGRQHCVSGYCVTLNEGEVTVEAGLCVVIPCSYRTGDGFTPKHIAWYKCEVSEPRCGNPIMIFHTNNSIKVQSGFKARVSFLEPDLSQNNCSFFINKLKQSDSGSYHLRVIGELNGKPDGFSFSPRVTVSQATLTCTAPGLCSGSVPQITWTWRGAGGTESYITGNSTDYKTENLTDVTQSPVSTLTFNPSAKHHNTNVTCKISFTGETITEETSTLNYFHYITLYEGETLNLTCSVESFPPSLIMWSKLGSDITLHNDTGSATLSIINATTGHSGQYVCTAKHMNNTLQENINITVIFHNLLDKDRISVVLLSSLIRSFTKKKMHKLKFLLDSMSYSTVSTMISVFCHHNLNLMEKCKECVSIVKK
uniref:Ig-like domain-containing protein n=1 Tax=Haplochromis burtoni TaxID=8153 RepID=A0A3Q3CT30_HAPBU